MCLLVPWMFIVAWGRKTWYSPRSVKCNVPFLDITIGFRLIQKLLNSGVNEFFILNYCLILFIVRRSDFIEFQAKISNPPFCTKSRTLNQTYIFAKKQNLANYASFRFKIKRGAGKSLLFSRETLSFRVIWSEESCALFKVVVQELPKKGESNIAFRVSKSWSKRNNCVAIVTVQEISTI